MDLSFLFFDPNTQLRSRKKAKKNRKKRSRQTYMLTGADASVRRVVWQRWPRLRAARLTVLRQATLQRLRGAFGPAATFVAVHVRLGDRALTPNWLAPTAEYVVAAVEHVRRLAGNAVFILFTGVAVFCCV